MPSSRPPPQNVHPQTPYCIGLDMSEALRNPYVQPAMNQFHSSTPEGYTLSSTYGPRASMYSPSTGSGGYQASSSVWGRGQGHRTQASSIPRQPIQQSGSWYQSGNSRCTYQSCSFFGSSKAVEIHMMDRHLIYPSGWVKKKKGSDWDADPSLKGKTVPIQGTSITLDTPEAIDTWLAERKKRWPTAQRVEEKKKKMEEAIVRGQLPLVNSSFRGTKRQRGEERKPKWNNTNRHRSSAQMKRQKIQNTKESQTIVSQTSLVEMSKTDLGSKINFDARCPDSDSDDDKAPEVVTSKPPISHPLSVGQETSRVSEGATEVLMLSELPSANKKFIRPRKREPKLPSRNPFAARPTLLRNLLLPEIRMTVSNLSQAIRFLVDNDFLRDVELKPGQADHTLIEVVDSKSS